MNNRNEIILKICILLIVVFVLVSILLFFIDFDFSKKLSRFNKEYELIMTETYDVENITKINFNLKSADLDIKYSDDDKAKLEIYDVDKSKVDVNFDNGNLDVKFSGNSFCFGWCITSRKAVLYLPISFSKEIKVLSASGYVNIVSLNEANLEIKTASGDVEVYGSKTLNVETASGDVYVEKVPSIKFKTVSGDVSVNDVEKLDGGTTSGEIDILNLNGVLDLNTVSGDIEIERVNLNSSSKISTVSGDIEVTGINSVNVNTSTVSGDVSVYTRDKNSNILLDVKTTSGDIEIE